MTPTELKTFLNTTRPAFFAKYPRPSRKGARGFWRDSVRHVANIHECAGVAGYWDPAALDGIAARIKKYLGS